jgi:hypothetical protein
MWCTGAALSDRRDGNPVAARRHTSRTRRNMGLGPAKRLPPSACRCSCGVPAAPLCINKSYRRRYTCGSAVASASPVLTCAASAVQRVRAGWQAAPRFCRELEPCRHAILPRRRCAKTPRYEVFGYIGTTFREIECEKFQSRPGEWCCYLQT